MDGVVVPKLKPVDCVLLPNAGVVVPKENPEVAGANKDEPVLEVVEPNSEGVGVELLGAPNVSCTYIDIRHSRVTVFTMLIKVVERTKTSQTASTLYSMHYRPSELSTVVLCGLAPKQNRIRHK